MKKERSGDPNARIIFTVILLLAIAAFILFAIFTPRRAEITDGTLHFKHLFTSFDVPLGEIESVELLDMLPSLSKVSGIGVYFLSEGTYDVEGYGRCTVSLDQSEPPFIAITAADGAWVFSMNAAEETAALYEELAAEAVKHVSRSAAAPLPCP